MKGNSGVWSWCGDKQVVGESRGVDRQCCEALGGRRQIGRGGNVVGIWRHTSADGGGGQLIHLWVFVSIQGQSQSAVETHRL